MQKATKILGGATVGAVMVGGLIAPATADAESVRTVAVSGSPAVTVVSGQGHDALPSRTEFARTWKRKPNRVDVGDVYYNPRAPAKVCRSSKSKSRALGLPKTYYRYYSPRKNYQGPSVTVEIAQLRSTKKAKQKVSVLRKKLRKCPRTMSFIERTDIVSKVRLKQTWNRSKKRYRGVSHNMTQRFWRNGHASYSEYRVFCQSGRYLIVVIFSANHHTGDKMTAADKRKTRNLALKTARNIH